VYVDNNEELRDASSDNEHLRAKARARHADANGRDPLLPTWSIQHVGSSLVSGRISRPSRCTVELVRALTNELLRRPGCSCLRGASPDSREGELLSDVEV
jgi:hypothetical protein